MPSACLVALASITASLGLLCSTACARTRRGAHTACWGHTQRQEWVHGRAPGVLARHGGWLRWAQGTPPSRIWSSGHVQSKLPLTLSTIQAPPAAYRENHAECRHSHGQHQWSTMFALAAHWNQLRQTMIAATIFRIICSHCPFCVYLFVYGGEYL